MKCLKFVLAIGLTLGSASVGAKSGATSAAPLQEFKCGVFVTDKSGKVDLQVLPALHVLGMAAPPHGFALPSDAPSGVSSVFCVRSAIELAGNDYEILLAGYPFIIYSSNAERIGSMEIVNGRLQLRMILGEMTPKENSDGQQYLNDNQAKFDAK
jgi:hypothetical protein